MPPRLARLVAVIAAIGLVVAALLLRSALAGDDDPAAERDPGREATDSRPSADDGGAYAIACDADLAAVCQALRPLGEVRVLAGGTAVADDLAVDAWVTLDPLPEARAFERDEDAPAAAPLGSTTLALLTSEGGGVDCADLACTIAAAEGEQVGIPGEETSLGIVVRAALALVAVPDLEEEGSAIFPDVADALDDILDQRDQQATDRQVLAYLTQRGRYDGVITTADAAAAAAASGQGRGKVAVPLTPEVTVGVVVVGFGDRGDGAVDAITEAVSRETLRQDGFGGGPAASSGLPEADIVLGLREELG